jgi:hypothetical protein
MKYQRLRFICFWKLRTSLFPLLARLSRCIFIIRDTRTLAQGACIMNFNLLRRSLNSSKFSLFVYTIWIKLIFLSCSTHPGWTSHIIVLLFLVFSVTLKLNPHPSRQVLSGHRCIKTPPITDVAMRYPLVWFTEEIAIFKSRIKYRRQTDLMESSRTSSIEYS